MILLLTTLAEDLFSSGGKEITHPGMRMSTETVSWW
jgi:hypothetical protein